MSIVPPRKFNWKAPDPPHYDTQEKVMTRTRIVTIFKSKTFWGGVAAAAGTVLAAPAITLDVVLQAGGIVLGAAGLRDSVTKLSGLLIPGR